MTFGNLRKNLGNNSKKGNYELLRFCNSINITVIGGASKLFKYFLSNYTDVIQIISYADRCWSNGNLYRKLGFELDSITEPNYYYIIDNIRRNRYNYRKDKLISMGYDKNKSENTIMREIGYNRIYDCGSLKFIFNKKSSN
jgi:hypothetical protein